ncbi:TIR domain-containing protein [Photobacterium damselae]|uniref:toll/interleukin-1 receptor domain-containing protein n=1 Tax=Photobacterium damselae TaxID=38293 RepID=UPI003C6E114A
MAGKDFEYLISLSFAGEDREYVGQIAEGLKNSGISVFYDIYEQASLWGKDLYEHLTEVYQNKSKYVIVFISEHYEKKLWTTHERKMAQARAFRESKEYILPVRFDDTLISGIPDTVGYLDARVMTPKDVVFQIKEKLKSEGVSITKQQAFSNQQLREKTESLLIKLRDDLEEHEYKQSLLTLHKNPRMTESDIANAWEINSKKRHQLSRWFMNNYDKRYRAQATLLKNEMIQRLNLRERDKYQDVVYDNPVNPFGIKEIIADLEKLSFMLD